jgi:hypothetical protein
MRVEHSHVPGFSHQKLHACSSVIIAAQAEKHRGIFHPAVFVTGKPNAREMEMASFFC